MDQEGCEFKRCHRDKGIRGAQDFIVKGIKAGKPEYRYGAVHGNPYFRILRSQIEQYITEELGREHLETHQKKFELKKIKTEISQIKRRLAELEARRGELETALKR